MKILHVITSLRTGGAEKLMVDILPRMNNQGIQADLCIFDGVRTPFYDDIRAKGVNVIDFGVGNSVYNPQNINRLRRILRNYDIIHTHNTSPQFFTAIANIGIGKKLVTTEHNTYNRRRSWPGFATIDRWMYGKYKSIICISDKAEENLRKFLGSESTAITTIYNGVDINSYANAEPSLELEQIAPGSKKIIMVAAFRPQKDQATLIKAIKQLPEDFHLFLVGEGECKEENIRLSKQLGIGHRIHFMGRRSDVAQLLRASDYVVMSSHYEGLSLSSVEGMSVGKPFIASDVDGLREVVKGYGVLFPHQDSNYLANTISSLPCDSENYLHIAESCQQRAKQYDIDNMIKGYLNLYKSI